MPGTFWHVKPGDTVVRMIAGSVPHHLLVSKVDDTLIYCGVPISDCSPDAWTFDRETGVEVDSYLGWGPTTGRTGSFLVRSQQGEPDAPKTPQ